MIPYRFLTITQGPLHRMTTGFLMHMAQSGAAGYDSVRHIAHMKVTS
jgi:hypothetical protein